MAASDHSQLLKVVESKVKVGGRNISAVIEFSGDPESGEIYVYAKYLPGNKSQQGLMSKIEKGRVAKLWLHRTLSGRFFISKGETFNCAICMAYEICPTTSEQNDICFTFIVKDPIDRFRLGRILAYKDYPDDKWTL